MMKKIFKVKYGLKTAKSLLSQPALLPSLFKSIVFINGILFYADPDDNKYCDWGIFCAAKYVVSEDKNLSVPKNTAQPPL